MQPRSEERREGRDIRCGREMEGDGKRVYKGTGVQTGSLPVSSQVGERVPQALRLGRNDHRGDADLLSAAAPAAQTPEVEPHARAAEPGAAAAHPRGADLSQCS